MRRILFFTVLAVFTLVSCNEIDETAAPEEVNSISVTLPDLVTKAMIEQQGADYKVFWKARDVVSSGTNNLSTPLKGVSANSQTEVFTFSKPVGDGDFVRYPASSSPYTIAISAEQNSEDGQCDPAAAPFYGIVSIVDGQPTPVELKSSVAIIKFALKGDVKLVQAKVEALNSEPLNGKFRMSRSGEFTGGVDTEATTTILFDTPLQLNSESIRNFYIPVLPASYSKGLSVNLYDEDGRYMKVVLFEEGQALKAQTMTGFNVEYKKGFKVSVKPNDDFGAGTYTELPPEPLFGRNSAQGTVMYDDGQPAVGVRVSDGFSVVVTDEEGNYGFETAGNDVRYIYISYPSDARVTVSSDGCPEFYQKYESGKYIYDFTLRRQPVENRFAIFAMADPQTHYAKRDTQKSADTDRFGAETVPAVNAEIAKQDLPCYGVSLGDITYSEGNRDSTPSMTIIRSHFADMNMPVFNVYGNHDYTFYKTNATISTDAGSSTINLLSQRSFEDVFGPINYSFDRGKVHFVCMKDVCFTSTTTWNASSYQGGFTEAEYNWLVQDLAGTPKDMKVVLCVHIPISTSSSGPYVKEVRQLLSQFNNSIVFSGHTHYKRSVYDGNRLYEHIHAAVCGQWWWSKIEGDGCPNGYTVYHFNGTEIEDSYFIGVNEGMNIRDYQMRIYRGDIQTGGKYAYFKSPYTKNDYMINVFNGDAKWDVKVYENDVYVGKATLLPATTDRFSKVSSGSTYTFANNSSKDWWAVGYHIGVCKRGTSSTSYYTTNYHMWKWTSTNPSAKISVEAEDPHGNVYTCDDVVTDGSKYPDYIKAPLTLF